MSILVNKDTKLVVQGITGRDGKFHTARMVEYGTNVVAGVSPGKEGETIEGVPVFNSVEKAVKATGANTSIIFVPAAYAADAIMEASEAGIKLVVAISEGVPIQDMIRVTPILKQNGTLLIGPNCRHVKCCWTHSGSTLQHVMTTRSLQLYLLFYANNNKGKMIS